MAVAETVLLLMVVANVVVTWFAARPAAFVVTPVAMLTVHRESVTSVAVAAVSVRTLPEAVAVNVVVPQPAFTVGVASDPNVKLGRAMAIVSLSAMGREFLKVKAKETVVLTPTRPGELTPASMSSVSAKVEYTAGEMDTGAAAAAVLLMVVIYVRLARLDAWTVVPVVMPVAMVTVHVDAAMRVAVPAVSVRVAPAAVPGKVVVPHPAEYEGVARVPSVHVGNSIAIVSPDAMATLLVNENENADVVPIAC